MKTFNILVSAGVLAASLASSVGMASASMYRSATLNCTYPDCSLNTTSTGCYGNTRSKSFTSHNNGNGSWNINGTVNSRAYYQNN